MPHCRLHIFFSVRLFLIIVFLLLGTNSRANDPIVLYTNAKNSFDSGDYAQASQRFFELLKQDLNNPALLIEIRKYLAVSYIFLQKLDQAEEQFLALLNQDPNFELDPLVFPIDAVDFFTSIKKHHSERLKRIAQASAKAEKQRLKEEEKQRLKELEKLKEYIYLEHTVLKHSKIVAGLPFGAGQFQNKQNIKGWIFLTTQFTFLTSSMITYGLHENLRNKAQTPFYSTSDRKKYEYREKSFRIANRLSIAGFALSAIIGIVDSIYHFTPYDESWKQIEESDVPRQYHKKTQKSQISIVPILGRDMAGIGASGNF